MGNSHFSGDVYGAGMRLGSIPGGSLSPRSTPLPGGRVYYVGNASWNSPGNGESAEKPLASAFGANGALAKIASEGRTNRGDVILFMPGYSESVSSADFASHLSTMAGISMVGCGEGSLRPTLTWTIAGSTFLLDTAGIELANFNLYLAGAHAAGSALTVAAPITVSGQHCRILNNNIWWGFDADQIVGDAIIWTGKDGLFAGNRCFAETAAVPSNTFLTMTGSDRLKVVNNWIKGPTDGTTRGVIDTETTNCVDLLIEGNYLANMVASSTIAASFTASDTGVARFNHCFVDTGILPFTAGELEWYQNYVVNDEGEAGALVGTASA